MLHCEAPWRGGRQARWISALLLLLRLSLAATPRSRLPQGASYSTRCDATAEEVIGWNASRWGVEVAFRDSKQRLGFEAPQGWSRSAALRTAPVAMLLHPLVVLWFGGLLSNTARSCCEI